MPEISSWPHPKLIVQQGPVDGLACLIACDGKILEAGGSIVEGLDMLFKFLWVFDLKYDKGLLNFYLFLQCAVYKIGQEKIRIPGCISELIKILNFK